MKKEMNNINLDDDLDIMDLDEEEIVYGNIDKEMAEDMPEEAFEEARPEELEMEAPEEADVEIADLDAEFMAEEPYVVPQMEEVDLEDTTEEAAQEYDEAEEAFERADSRKKKESDDEEKAGFMAGLLDRLIHMDTMDKIIASLGCVVLVLAIVALSIFSAYR